MRVLVTGSRTYSNDDVVNLALMSLPKGSVVIHGAASGADALASAYVLTLRRNSTPMEDGELTQMPFPAKWETEGRGAGPKRNTRMLDEAEPDMVMAFVQDPTSSPGTANMVLQALARGLPMWLFDKVGNLTVIQPHVTTLRQHVREAKTRAALDGGD